MFPPVAGSVPVADTGAAAVVGATVLPAAVTGVVVVGIVQVPVATVMDSTWEALKGG